MQELGALVQLELARETWEEVVQEALAVLPQASDDALAAAASFVLKAAAECDQLPKAVSASPPPPFPISIAELVEEMPAVSQALCVRGADVVRDNGWGGGRQRR